MASASMMTVLPSTLSRPIDERNVGLSETVSASVISLEYYRCTRSDIFASVRELEENWDGHGAQQPCKHSIELSRQFWLSLRKRWRLPLPKVMATSEGGVYLEWDTPSAVLMVEFGPGDNADIGNADIFAKTTDFDVDGPLKDYGREFWLTVSAL